MRLIDADVLKQHIDKLPALPDGNFAGNHSALKALINMQPTIEPSTNCSEFPNNSDAVSRQEAIDALDCISGVEEVLRNLPSVQPESSDKFIPPEQLAIKLGTATIHSAMQWIEFCNALEFLGYAIVERRTE